MRRHVHLGEVRRHHGLPRQLEVHCRARRPAGASDPGRGWGALPARHRLRGTGLPAAPASHRHRPPRPLALRAHVRARPRVRDLQSSGRDLERDLALHDRRDPQRHECAARARAGARVGKERGRLRTRRAHSSTGTPTTGHPSIRATTRATPASSARSRRQCTRAAGSGSPPRPRASTHGRSGARASCRATTARPSCAS